MPDSGRDDPEEHAACERRAVDGAEIGSLVLLTGCSRHPVGTSFPLISTPMTLGRVEGADIVLDDPTVARRHGRFRLRDGAWWVSDEASPAGTFVAGMILRGPHRLGEGDIIGFGQMKVRFTRGASQAKGQPAPGAGGVVPPACLLLLRAVPPHPLGTRFDLVRPRTILGRLESVDLVLDSHQVARRHACVEVHEGAHILVDGGSTQGTTVNGEPVARPRPLATGDVIEMGDVRLRFLAGPNLDALVAKARRDLWALDDLTGVHSAAYLRDLLESLCRSSVPVALVLADVDRLARLNAEHGYASLNVALKEVAEMARRLCGPLDQVARCPRGGFVLLMPRGDHARASAVGEELRRQVAERVFAHENGALRLTLSVGIGFAEGGTAQELRGLAEERLQEAKTAGGDRVA
jgi:diguanylate cyclase (GGDEF)-like protein